MGDFLQDNVDSEFVEYWNHWLQAGLAVSQEQLGDSWKDKYLTGPVWHFALSSNIAGVNAKMGTMIPSIDAVGRHFPFTVVANTDALPLSVLNAKIFNIEYEDEVLSVLEDSIDVKRWRNQLQDTLNSTVSGKKFKHFVPEDTTKHAFVMEYDTDELGENIVEDILHTMLYKKYSDYSIWWTQGSNSVNPVVLVTSALPPVNQLAAMLDGRWQHWEWHHTQLVNEDAK